MPTVKLPDVELPSGSTEQKLQYLTDLVTQYKKSLEYFLGNLDSSNIGEIDASKVNVINLVVGGNVEMGPDATISWSKVEGGDSAVTVITNNSIKTAEIEADQITTGTLTGIIINGVEVNSANINISEDVSIGEKLIISGINFDAGVIWKNAAGSTIDQIFIDPATKAMFLEANGGNSGIYANGRRIDLGATFA